MHALLNRHPEITLMYEAEPLELWPGRHCLLIKDDWPKRLEFFNQTFTRHKLDGQKFRPTPAGPEGALALYRAYAHGARVIGEKAPSYHNKLAALSRLFPDAHFLIIWRDPIDCCRSAARAARKNRFFGQRGILSRMLFGAETFAQGVEELLREKRNVCEVAYNDLVKNPESELRRVCEFLKIPFNPVMLDLKSADTSSVPSGEHHGGVRSGVIGRPAETEEILAPEFVAKGRRYAKAWRERYSHLKFAGALTTPAERGPRWMERFSDACVKNFWRSIDALKRFVFRRIPLSWWARLRSRPRK